MIQIYSQIEVDKALKKNYQVDLSALMRLYETNYAKLVRLLPKDHKVGNECIYDIQGSSFQLEIVEVTPYTTVLLIRLMEDVPDYLKPNLKVRLYHDAKVAEVCSNQKISRIQPKYEYPNSKMHQKNEKHQVNAFLSDWLVHCLKNGTMLSY